MAESEEELKNLSMRVKEESEKAGLKLNIQKSNIMASGHITSPKIDGEKVETVTGFIFLGSKMWMVTGAMELKDTCSLGKKAMINLDSILKSRGITLYTKFHIVKAMGFPVFMYRCDNWTIKKAEYQIIFFFNYLNKDVFELCC